jgi:type VI secretion system secreted protein Hcp
MAFDAFLKLGDIKGESQVKGFEDQIQIESFHWGVANTASSGGGGAGGGVATRQDFLLTADSSKASPELFIASVTGEHIKEGLLTLRQAGEDQSTLSTIKLSDVVITVYDQAGSSEGDRPMDEFALNYAKLEFSYNGVKASYDFLKGVKG